MDDEVDRGRDLLADRSHGQVEASHEHHRLDTRQGVAGAVGVNGRQRTVVTGVHRLEHVEGFAAAALSHDDPVGTHAQAVPDQVTNADLSLALDVGGASFQSKNVILVELELGGVFHSDDALLVRQVARQHVERGRLSRPGTTGDDDVEAAPDAGTEEVGSALGKGVET